MPLFPAVTPVFLDKITTLLVPLFLTAAGGDAEAAGHAARCMIASYDVETEEEIHLAAEIASFGFGALDALSASMDAELSPRAVLRLRGSANAQHRSAHQCQRTLDRLRKERRMPSAQPVKLEQPEEHDQAHPASPAAPASQGAPPITVSRQQRRAMERALEKAQRQQAEHVRREAMRAKRAASVPSVATALIPRQAPAHNLAA